jgi:hypothetical protein
LRDASTLTQDPSRQNRNGAWPMAEAMRTTNRNKKTPSHFALLATFIIGHFEKRAEILD